jgi:hypothetical protein
MNSPLSRRIRFGSSRSVARNAAGNTDSNKLQNSSASENVVLAILSSGLLGSSPPVADASPPAIVPVSAPLAVVAFPIERDFLVLPFF